MTLAPGQSSGDEPEAHQGSEQILLLVDGMLTATINGRRSALGSGDAVVIPPGVKHKFTNPGKSPAITFSVYAPPEYPSGQKG